ncbi:carbohydrate ABC transporter permease [Arthrobacter sp. MI7-26]|uniref:carbohydrate ABC transporter permease n=1 Tax=Arthrobacter sp. MI7-26 TaxID=2993653 RepID=UPI002249187D|nr:carbohydrate ABC transporter permease [Arthrobacter sp. MI7-26]MCX2750064.1 carbohydrate ABC transporter permease [Arthrobacter sp. MI7-26]
MFEARTRLTRVILQVVVTVLVLPFLFPLAAMLQGSLAGEGWGNYAKVLAVPGFGLFFRNSAIMALATIVIVYIVALLAAYGFSKLHIRGREIYFWLLLACLTLPEVVLLTPLFVTATNLGLYNTYWAVVLPLAALQIPFAVLLARNFLNGIPNELFEAARVDGANAFRAFWYIVIPLSRPIAAAIVIFTLLASWNDYLLPLVFLQDPDVQAITLIPQFFVGEFSNDQTKVLASAVITALPEVLAYLLLQRYFERGLAAGAIK